MFGSCLCLWLIKKLYNACAPFKIPIIFIEVILKKSIWLIWNMLRFDRSEKSTFFEQLISMPWNHLVVWRSIFIECWVSFFFLLINEDVFLWISRFSVSVRNIIIFPFCFAEDVKSLRGGGGGGLPTTTKEI